MQIKWVDGQVYDLGSMDSDALLALQSEVVAFVEQCKIKRHAAAAARSGTGDEVGVMSAAIRLGNQVKLAISMALGERRALERAERARQNQAKARALNARQPKLSRYFMQVCGEMMPAEEYERYLVMARARFEAAGGYYEREAEDGEQDDAACVDQGGYSGGQGLSGQTPAARQQWPVQ